MGQTEGKSKGNVAFPFPRTDKQDPATIRDRYQRHHSVTRLIFRRKGSPRWRCFDPVPTP